MRRGKVLYLRKLCGQSKGIVRIEKNLLPRWWILQMSFLREGKETGGYMQITSTTYLTRTLLNKVFEKELTTDEIDDLVLDGTILKHFAYYKPSEKLLRKLKVIPSTVKIERFNELAKKSSFVLKDIMYLFDANIDTAKLIARKYFERRYNYYYKNDVLIHILSEGEEYVRI